jgi:hypothetical protein
MTETRSDDRERVTDREGWDTGEDELDDEHRGAAAEVVPDEPVDLIGQEITTGPGGQGGDVRTDPDRIG